MLVLKLQTLPPDKLAMAANYVESLKSATLAERLSALEATGGALSAEEADELERAIEEGCERIDPTAW